ncbi:MAG TPA: 6-phosphogluconolactonase [Acidobacteriota bacterium]
MSKQRGSPVRRVVGDNVWFSDGAHDVSQYSQMHVYPLRPEILDNEEAVGRAMVEELEKAARTKGGDLSIALLGGRGGQAMHRILGQRARNGELDWLFQRLHVFTQDALAPLSKENGFSFVRDFERLLGSKFFGKIKSFTPMPTDASDVEAALIRYLQKLEGAGGLDIFFLGHGPEPGAASHLAYIRPGSGATNTDVAGIVPVSASILEHHIAKFKAGGLSPSSEDEAQCRNVTHIVTLGPAAILQARRVVQSIVDSSTAPSKRASYRRVLDTGLADDSLTRARQLDENPGLWIRLHPNVRSLVLADLLT